MAIKWGSTLCIVIKWGSTTCTVVYWGSTKVWPNSTYDSSNFCSPFNSGMVVNDTGSSNLTYIRTNVSGSSTNGYKCWRTTNTPSLSSLPKWIRVTYYVSAVTGSTTVNPGVNVDIGSTHISLYYNNNTIGYFPNATQLGANVFQTSNSASLTNTNSKTYTLYIAPNITFTGSYSGAYKDITYVLFSIEGSNNDTKPY